MSLFLSCLFTGVAQTKPVDGRLRSFEQMKEEFSRRHYELVFTTAGLEHFPKRIIDIPFDSPVEDLVRDWLKGLYVYYNIAGNSIILRRADSPTQVKHPSLYKDIQGKILGPDHQPLVGATVTIPASKNSVITGKEGKFVLPVDTCVVVFVVSHIGLSEKRVKQYNWKEEPVIVMEPLVVGLDRVFVMPYGHTTRRLNTGNITQITGEELESEPTGNVLTALQGRVPGFFIAAVSGVAGAAKLVTIGGTHSLQQSNDPLYIVNGVPLAGPGFLTPIPSGNAQGPLGASALNFIAPENIDTITVLKGADATSIYGSRGSNGVVLITLKKGKTGAFRLSFDVSGGLQEAVKTSPLLSTAQFLSLREEAVSNDGRAVDSNSVPEAFHWDPGRQMNYQRFTIGRKAPVWNAGLQAGWGSDRSAFFLSGQLHRESTVFPGSTLDERKSIYGYWSGQSANGRLRASVSGIYGWEGNHLPAADFSAYQWLAPNAPPFKDKGVTQWHQSSLSFVNIPALENNDYSGKTHTLLGHLDVSYRIGKHIDIEENLGYNGIHMDEHSYLRDSGQDPLSSVGDVVSFANNRYSHYMTETIGRWSGKAGPGKLEGLAGFDHQWRKVNYQSSFGRDTIPYHYHALFARVNYNVGGKYLLTSSWRQDQSTVLGAEEPLGNFWTVGGAWIFSNEPFLKGNKMLSHGKIRGSWGTTGNEPREDELLAEAQAIALARGLPPIGGRQLIIPAHLPLHWELNYREELALELGFLQDRIFLTVGVNRGWTANQLIYPPVLDLSQVQGLLSDQRGIDIENRAFELGLQLDRLKWGKFGLASSFNLTIPRNRIAGWPGLESSIYKDQYTIGHSLTSTLNFHSTGVDPIGGLYTFQTANANGVPDASEVVPDKGLDPSWYAGWNQRLILGNWELEWLFDYRRQRGINPLIVLDRLNPPGAQDTVLQLSNGPVEWLDRWRKRGDVTQQQRLTAGGDTAAMARLTAYENSDAWSIGASYLRLRKLTLSYRLSPGMAKRLGLREGRISISGQNLWTRTRYPVSDPETQYPNVLPPMRIIVAGVRVVF